MNMNKKTIKDVDLKGKKVFCRVDYNVPFDENMNITNDTRILATVPTVTICWSRVQLLFSLATSAVHLRHVRISSPLSTF